MSNSKKRTIGILSVLVLLCACLFFVTVTGNTREKAYATATSVDLTQTASYTIGTESELSAFTAVNGSTETSVATISYFKDATKAAPSAVEGGLSFSIPFKFSVSYPVKFVTPIKAESEVFDKLIFTLTADLTNSGTIYGDWKGSHGIWGTQGILIYPLDATGAVGEGYRIPWDIIQRKEITVAIEGDIVEGFKNADGEVAGFIIAASFGGWDIGAGGSDSIIYSAL